jgi:hypothetical protein
MSNIRNLIVVFLFVSIVCVRGANATENTSDSILAPPEATANYQSAETPFDVLGWLISQFSAAVPTKENEFSPQRGLKAPPLT